MASFLVSAPAVEPVTVEEAKAHMRVDSTSDDTLIASLIEVARSQSETELSRAFIHQSWRLTLDQWPQTRCLALPRAPAETISTITYYDRDGMPAMLASEAYQLAGQAVPPHVVFDHSYLPAVDQDHLNGVEIDYVAGYGAAASDVPAPLRHAILLLTAHLYETREAALSQSLMITPKGYDALIAPFRLRRIGG